MRDKSTCVNSIRLTVRSDDSFEGNITQQVSNRGSPCSACPLESSDRAHLEAQSYQPMYCLRLFLQFGTERYLERRAMMRWLLAGETTLMEKSITAAAKRSPQS